MSATSKSSTSSSSSDSGEVVIEIPPVVAPSPSSSSSSSEEIKKETKSKKSTPKDDVKPKEETKPKKEESKPKEETKPRSDKEESKPKEETKSKKDDVKPKEESKPKEETKPKKEESKQTKEETKPKKEESKPTKKDDAKQKKSSKKSSSSTESSSSSDEKSITPKKVKDSSSSSDSSSDEVVKQTGSSSSTSSSSEEQVKSTRGKKNKKGSSSSSDDNSEEGVSLEKYLEDVTAQLVKEMAPKIMAANIAFLKEQGVMDKLSKKSNKTDFEKSILKYKVQSGSSTKSKTNTKTLPTLPYSIKLVKLGAVEGSKWNDNYSKTGCLYCHPGRVGKNGETPFTLCGENRKKGSILCPDHDKLTTNAVNILKGLASNKNFDEKEYRGDIRKKGIKFYINVTKKYDIKLEPVNVKSDGKNKQIKKETSTKDVKKNKNVPYTHSKKSGRFYDAKTGAVYIMDDDDEKWVIGIDEKNNGMCEVEFSDIAVLKKNGFENVKDNAMSDDCKAEIKKKKKSNK